VTPDEIYRIYSEKPPDPADVLIAEIRGFRADVAELRSAIAKNGNGNGGNGTRIPQWLTERAVQLLLAGLIALTAWVGVTNVRLAEQARDIGANARATVVNADDVKALEAWRERHMETGR